MLETGHEYGNMRGIMKIIQAQIKVPLLNIYIYIHTQFPHILQQQQGNIINQNIATSDRLFDISLKRGNARVNTAVTA
jgi:hypothetical protein